MRTESILTLIVTTALLIGGGCKDDGAGPGPTPTSGRATLNTRYVNHQASGFSFDRAAIVVFPNWQGTLPDLCAFVQINQPGRVIGVFFTRPDSFVQTFCLLRQFVSLDSAQAYFQSVTEIPDTTYTDLALTLSAGQIWAVKTRRATFAKILIRHTLAFVDSSAPGLPTPYGEATFDWAYQPDGTKRF